MYYRSNQIFIPIAQMKSEWASLAMLSALTRVFDKTTCLSQISIYLFLSK